MDKMNTLLHLPDVETYLLYYLDIRTIIRLTSISKDQYTLLTNIKFVSELRIMRKTKNIVGTASQKGFITVLNWLDSSINKFIYTPVSTILASEMGHVHILDWFDKSRHQFIYSNCAITVAAANGARRRSR